MDTSLLNNPVERRKAVRLRTRPDLQISEQRYEGKVYHVVKDPVCLRYYRFNRQEYFVFRLFDGGHTMEEVKGEFENEFKPHRLEYNDLEGFARQLITAGLVQNETVGSGKHLFERRAKQRRMKRLALMLYIILIPLTFPYLGVEGIKVTLRMAWKSLTGRRSAPGIEDAAESPPAQAA